MPLTQRDRPVIWMADAASIIHRRIALHQAPTPLGSRRILLHQPTILSFEDTIRASPKSPVIPGVALANSQSSSDLCGSDLGRFQRLHGLSS